VTLQRLRSLLRRALSRANDRLGIVATGDENEYYAWADERLDQMAEEARQAHEREALRQRLAGRGYRLDDES
jgi:hypothetical protein